MNKIPPAALTNKIARSAASQMAEHDHAKKGKKHKVIACGSGSTFKEILRNMSVGAGDLYCGIDLSASNDMTADVVIKGK